MSTFVNRTPVEVLQDYRDELDHEILTLEQHIDRYINDLRRTEGVSRRLETVKQLRATRRKTNRALELLLRAETEPKVEP